MFASKQIEEGEELTFSYGQASTEPEPPISAQSSILTGSNADVDVPGISIGRHRRRCLCGSTACLGFLPGC